MRPRERARTSARSRAHIRTQSRAHSHAVTLKRSKRTRKPKYARPRVGYEDSPSVPPPSLQSAPPFFNSFRWTPPQFSVITPHSSLLTPHSSLFTPHSLLLTPRCSFLTRSVLTPHSPLGGLLWRLRFTRPSDSKVRTIDPSLSTKSKKERFYISID